MQQIDKIDAWWKTSDPREEACPPLLGREPIYPLWKFSNTPWLMALLNFACIGLCLWLPTLSITKQMQPAQIEYSRQIGSESVRVILSTSDFDKAEKFLDDAQAFIERAETPPQDEVSAGTEAPEGDQDTHDQKQLDTGGANKDPDDEKTPSP